MIKQARFLTISLLLMIVAAGCENRGGDSHALPPAPSSPKVVLIGIGGITWEDLTSVEDPYLSRIITNSVIGNVSVRVTNNSADAYATLGASQRTETDGSAAWAFDGNEDVENGSGLDLWARRTGSPVTVRTSGSVVVPTIGHLVEMNQGKAFDAVLGLLGTELEKKGLRTAVLGNADLSLGSLPSVLPSVKRMQEPLPPETGIHREAALAAINSEGGVASGDVSRELLDKDPESLFGIRTNPGAMLDAFRIAYVEADLIVVETGETARADLYTEGLNDETALRMRRAALREVLTDQVRPIVTRAGPNALVVIFAPTTPGGPEERGQLRPVILTGAGITPGLAVTRSTRRAGIITVPDISATIARHFGLTDDAFGVGHAVKRSAPGGAGQTEALVERNTRAVVHDAVRAPVSIAIILLHLALYVLAVYQLRRGALKRWVQVLLLVALAFPLASFASSSLPIPITEMAAVAVIIVVAVVLGALSWMFSRSPEKAATMLLAATALFFFIDLTLGAQAQLDSVLGYTSVAAGRFFGLGNLGFALFASSILLLAAVTGDRSDSRRGRGIRVWLAIALVSLAIVWIGHPSLGSDVGGVLTMIPALFVFIYALAGRGPLRLRHLPAIVLFTVAVALIFGLLDLARPLDQRTHLGDFLTDLVDDPLYLFLVIRRKLGLAISLTFSTRWGLAVPGALAVLVWLYRRARGQFRQMLEGRDALRAGLHALFTAALVGSLVNDSGIAVAGMMLAVATPWALLTASTNEARITG